MIDAFKRLHEKGILGINQRNLLLVNEFNTRRNMKLVNDKLATKHLAEEAGIPVPALYGSVSTLMECQHVARYVSPEKGAVIKPVRGAQGKGVLIISKKLDENQWLLGNGNIVTEGDLTYHATNILSGMYSLSGQPDEAMIEERVVFDDAFKDVTFKGVPDIRIIVLKGVPVASMLRLPTAKSDGKANLHRGGIGAGVDLATGKTMNAMAGTHSIHLHPDTGAELLGLSIPQWDAMLEMSARAHEVTGLGYLGSDIVLDKTRGPLLLELNARPGLSIQIAMRRGLLELVRPVLKTDTKGMSVADRIALGKSLWQSPAPAEAV